MSSKFEIVDNNLAFLSFDADKLPVTRIDYRGYVTYGEKNDYFRELIRLYEEHAEHGAIIGQKARFGRGKSLKAKNEAQQPLLDQFWDSINRYETYEAFAEKFWIDAEIFNGVYFQVLTDLSGRITDIFHLQRTNCRLSEDATTLFHCEDWLDQFTNPVKEYPIYVPGKAGLSFIEFKFYQPSATRLNSLYPLPPYNQCTTEIKSDIDISTFNYNYVKNGFSAGYIVTFFNGEPDEPKKKDIRKRFKNAFTGGENAGNVIINYAGKEGQAAQITAIPIDGLDEKFTTIQKRYQQKIFTGHNIVNPELFGIKTEGQLGNRVSLKESHELFINSYVKPRQEIANNFWEKLCFMKTGQWVEMESVQIDAIGFDLSDDQDLTVDERRILKGYDSQTTATKPQAQAVNDAINALSPLVANKVLESMSEDEIRALASLPPKAAVLNPDGSVATNPDGTPIVIQESEVNDHLKNLTGKQMQQMNRLAKQFRDGKITESQAMLQLKGGFGLSDEDARSWLGVESPAPVQMSAVDFILAQFEAIDTTDENEYELLDEYEHIHSSDQARHYELSAVVKFADKPTFIETLVGKIGNLLGPKPKGGKEKEEVTEIVTKYHYALKEGALPAKSGSRPFCKKMMEMAAAGKEFTYEQIDSVKLAGVKNGMPKVDNIWDYRGGFYTKPGTNETDPFCRHVWKARTYRIKRKS